MSNSSQGFTFCVTAHITTFYHSRKGKTGILSELLLRLDSLDFHNTWPKLIQPTSYPKKQVSLHKQTGGASNLEIYQNVFASNQF